MEKALKFNDIHLCCPWCDDDDSLEIDKIETYISKQKLGNGTIINGKKFELNTGDLCFVDMEVKNDNREIGRKKNNIILSFCCANCNSLLYLKIDINSGQMYWINKIEEMLILCGDSEDEL